MLGYETQEKAKIGLRAVAAVAGQWRNHRLRARLDGRAKLGHAGFCAQANADADQRGNAGIQNRVRPSLLRKSVGGIVSPVRVRKSAGAATGRRHAGCVASRPASAVTAGFDCAGQLYREVRREAAVAQREHRHEHGSWPVAVSRSRFAGPIRARLDQGTHNERHQSGSGTRGTDRSEADV